MDGSMMGRWLIMIGIGIVIIGFLFWLGGKMGLPFGQLPGDVSVSGEKYGFYFPIVTSIILSILLTVIINVVLWILRK